MIHLMECAPLQQVALALGALSHFGLPTQMILASEYRRLAAGSFELPMVAAALSALPMEDREELVKQVQGSHEELKRILAADQNFTSGSLVQLIGGSTPLGLGLIYPRNDRMHLILPDGIKTTPAALDLSSSARFLDLPQEDQPAGKIAGYALINDLMSAFHQDPLSEETVGSYTEMIQSGKKVKTIGVNLSTEDSETLVAANGHHRTFAAARLGYRYIRANLTPFPRLRPGYFLVKDLPLRK